MDDPNPVEQIMFPLPTETFSQITSLLANCPAALCSLALASQWTRIRTEPFIYCDLPLDRVATFKAYRRCIQTLASCPRRAEYVRSITLVREIAASCLSDALDYAEFLDALRNALHAVSGLETYRVIQAWRGARWISKMNARARYGCDSALFRNLEHSFPSLKEVRAPILRPWDDDYTAFFAAHSEIHTWFLEDAYEARWPGCTDQLPYHVLSNLRTVSLQDSVQSLLTLRERPLERMQVVLQGESDVWQCAAALEPFALTLRHFSIHVPMYRDESLVQILQTLSLPLLESLTIVYDWPVTQHIRQPLRLLGRFKRLQKFILQNCRWYIEDLENVPDTKELAILCMEVSESLSIAAFDRKYVCRWECFRLDHGRNYAELDKEVKLDESSWLTL